MAFETMTKEPCLCGDPGCSHSGDPAGAKLDAALEAMNEKIMRLGLDAIELTLFEKVGFEAVVAHRAACALLEQDKRAQWAEYDQHVAMLKSEIEDLHYQLIEANDRSER
jgi:cell division protein FtsB